MLLGPHFRRFGVFAVGLTLLGSAFGAAHEKVIHTFTGAPDGSTPSARLIQDAHGNFFGTTELGGANNQGSVFELSPNANGSWTEKVLYSFSGPDGSAPVASLVFDNAGNLYGTTAAGGAYSGGGVAFELSPSSKGWTETVLHSFGNGFDGWDPQAELVFDSAGNLYGTTQLGGAYFGRGDDNGGTVFRLSPGANGWIETVLYSFSGEYLGPDPNLPAGSVVFDNSGTIYGVAQAGGANGKGAVYQLAPNGDGTYSESVIYSFSGSDGQDPNSTPVFDANGNLYGTTQQGGHFNACPMGCGVVFKLTNNGNGTWSETALHELINSDGSQPVGPVAFDSSGNLYAAATSGGAASMGTVFELFPMGNGSWGDRVLHNFVGGTDGASPQAGVSPNAQEIFGTTSGGGSSSAGTAFVIKP